MDKKVYYGEYTLKYWIDLLLKKDLVLPDYQRRILYGPVPYHTLIEG